MLKPLAKNSTGIITISGPTKSGKSQLAEFLIKDHQSICYIATSKPRQKDQDWQRRISIHRLRRPNYWKLIEYPDDICKSIEKIAVNESILLDSLGGLVEQRLMDKNDHWEFFQEKFINCITSHNSLIIVVTEEVGWGIVPLTPIGHLFRERLSHLSSLVSRHATKRWLAVNGTAIDLDKIGYLIP
tara:strand:- start:547 stop:1104 length:558 start_codon:yes stop_codon:yes gene_type:complete